MKSTFNLPWYETLVLLNNLILELNFKVDCRWSSRRYSYASRQQNEQKTLGFFYFKTRIINDSSELPRDSSVRVSQRLETQLCGYFGLIQYMFGSSHLISCLLTVLVDKTSQGLYQHNQNNLKRKSKVVVICFLCLITFFLRWGSCWELKGPSESQSCCYFRFLLPFAASTPFLRRASPPPVCGRHRGRRGHEAPAAGRNGVGAF